MRIQRQVKHKCVQGGCSSPSLLLLPRFWQRLFGRHSSLVGPSFTSPPGGLSHTVLQQTAARGFLLSKEQGWGAGLSGTVPLGRKHVEMQECIKVRVSSRTEIGEAMSITEVTKY
jgi:hypothetical protein